MTVEMETASGIDQVVHLRVSWTAYASLVESLGDDSHARLTFDGETLEIMAPGRKHETIAKRVDLLLSCLVSEWNFNIEATGSTTFQKRGEVGFEADESYYIESASKIRNFFDVASPADPPPDLVLEVDITTRRSNKRRLYTRIGIPEFWRYRNDRLEACFLEVGEYVPIEVSRVIPGLPIRAVEELIKLPGTRLEVIAAFRRWLRDNRAPHETASAT